MIKSLIKRAMRTRTAGKYAQFILDVNRNENNSNMATNGEYLVERKYIRDGDVIFDIGANVGDWTEHCLTIAPRAIIHAFEPIREMYDILAARGFPDNVILNNCALGSVEEEKEILIYSGDNLGLGSFHERRLSDSHITSKEVVHVHTLDNYCRKNDVKEIDFLKIDVEGHEYPVLRGARDLIANKSIKAIQFEYGQTYIEARTYLKDIFSLFVPGTYAFHKLYPDGPREVSYSYDLENMRYSNYLIVRNEQI